MPPPRNPRNLRSPGLSCARIRHFGQQRSSGPRARAGQQSCWIERPARQHHVQHPPHLPFDLAKALLCRMPGFRTSNQDGAPSGTGPDLRQSQRRRGSGNARRVPGQVGPSCLSQKWLVRITPSRLLFHASIHPECQQAVFDVSRKGPQEEGQCSDPGAGSICSAAQLAPGALGIPRRAYLPAPPKASAIPSSPANLCNCSAICGDKCAATCGRSSVAIHGVDFGLSGSTARAIARDGFLEEVVGNHDPIPQIRAARGRAPARKLGAGGSFSPCATTSPPRP